MSKKPNKIKAFGQVAEELEARKPERWLAPVRNHCQALWALPIGTVEADNVYDVLSGIWDKVPAEAAKVRSRLEKILGYAMHRGYRERGVNPAVWAGNLEYSGLKASPKGGQQTSMRYVEAPAFMARLRSFDRPSARALEFTILTALRTVEVLEMRPSWYDRDTATLTVPGEFMKMKREHVVPLSPAAQLVLEKQLMWAEALGSDYVWPGQQGRDRMSERSMLQLLQRDMGIDVTVHGFRASFKTWASERVQDNGATPLYGADAVEFCLAHVKGGVEGAYLRSSMTEQRRVIMHDWAQHLEVQ